MTAGAQKALLASVVNNTGVIEARTLENHEGTIVLLGGMTAGTVNESGTLDASAARGGNGGSIDTSAAHVKITDTAKITTAAAMGLNGTWSIDPDGFTIASSGGDMTGTTLTAALANGDVNIQSTSGGGSDGNVNVNDAVSWSANKLALTATNDVNVNAVMTASGAASLDLAPGTNNVNMGFNPDGSFKGRVDFSGSGILRMNVTGTLQNFTVINSLGQATDAMGGANNLQGMAATANLSGNFALGSNIDAAATSSGWNSNAGFTPIGSSGTSSFTGIFDGLGHTINNLTINAPTVSDVGLFGWIGAPGIVRNVGLVGGSVLGSTAVGALAGNNDGSISNAYASAAVTGVANLVGGLVGQNYGTGTINNSYATGNITADREAGGLVGYNYQGGIISNSYARGTVSASGYGSVGGLVGSNSGAISNSYFTGPSVTGYSFVGGLVGRNYGSGTISQSYAISQVNGSTNVGGLVGGNDNAISASYASGTVTASQSNAGGLVGANELTITTSYSSANVNGPSYTGGLVGANFGTVSASHATGAVSGTDSVGGLVGGNTGQGLTAITDSYATGSVSGSSYVGGLIGSNRTGSVSNSYAIGAVTGGAYTGGLVGANNETITGSNASGPVSGNNYVGGLVGRNSAAIISSHASGDVTGVGGNIGGLAGGNSGSVSASYAIGNVSAPTTSNVGGLVGYNYNGSIDTSYATGTVSGISGVGGLVGLNYSGAATITSSHATGTTTGNSNVGGLVGTNNGAVSISYATGTVMGVGGRPSSIGGLLGINFGSVSRSFANGPVTGGGYTGGLVGSNYGTVANTYSTGSVTGSLNVGGLVGIVRPSSSVSNSYSIGSVSGSNFLGSLVGANYGAVTNSFYNNLINPGLTGIGGNSSTLPDVAGTVVGLTSAQMQSAATFTSAAAANGNANPNWDLVGTWIVYEGHTNPLLQVFMTPLTVTVSDATVTYSGTAYTNANSISYTVSGGDGNFFGTETFLASNGQAAVHAGTYMMTPAGSLYSDQLGYLITYVNGLLTINPAPLTVVGSAANKVYDGTTVAPLTGMLVGVFGGDTVTLTQAGTFASKNVGTGIAITANDSIGGTGAGDYILVEPTGLTGTITPAILTVSGTTVGGKTYNGTTAASLSGGSLVGLIGGDAVTLTQAGSFATKNAGTGIAVTAADGLSGTDVNNYTIVEPTGLTGAITPATLTVSGTTVGSKVYNGTTAASLSGGSLVGVIGGDIVTLTQAGSFASKNVGTGIAVTAADSLGGAEASDYTIIEPISLTGTITPATLTVSGTTVGSKVYNGTTAASLAGGSLVGLLSGDIVTLTQAGSFASKNVGTGIAVTAADSLGGADAGDYTIAEPMGLSSSITPAPLTVSGTTVGSKVYNGTTAASLAGGSLVGVVSGDTVTLNQSGIFASAGVGSGIAVTATDSLSGTSAFDYSISEPTGLTGSISPASNPPNSSSGLVLAALNARTQIVENFIYPQLGANPQVINPSPTIAVLATSADGASADAAVSHQAIAVNVSMKIGANGTLKIENGGLRLPNNLVVGDE
jgi:hypothetical protein